MNEIHIVTDLAAVWKKSLPLKVALPVLSRFCSTPYELAKNGYIILEGFADRIRGPRRERPSLNQPARFGLTALKYLEQFVWSTLSAEDTLKEESARCLWNPIFNAAEESMKKPDRIRGITH